MHEEKNNCYDLITSNRQVDIEKIEVDRHEGEILEVDRKIDI